MTAPRHHSVSSTRLSRLFGSATGIFIPLSLDPAGGEPGDDLALEDEDEDDERHGDDDRGRHQDAPRYLEGGRTGEERNRHRARALRIAEDEGQSEKKFVPRRDEGEEAGGHQRRPHQGQEHTGYDDPWRGAVDDRRLFDLDRQFAHEGGQDPYGERQGEDHVGEYERRQRVVDAHAADQLEKAGEHGDRREHRHREDEEEKRAAAAEADPRQREGGGDGEEDRDGDHGDRDDERIQEIAREVPFGHHGNIVVEGKILRPIVDHEQRRSAFERGQDRVVEGKDREDDDRR